MQSLSSALFISSLGGTLLLHYLKIFLLKERKKISLDWDALLERLLITCVIVAAYHLWILIPIIILIKILFRCYLLGSMPNIFQNQEPGIVSQKVLLKSELAFDFLLSPAFAILVGVLAK